METLYDKLPIKPLNGLISFFLFPLEFTSFVHKKLLIPTQQLIQPVPVPAVVEEDPLVPSQQQLLLQPIFLFRTPSMMVNLSGKYLIKLYRNGPISSFKPFFSSFSGLSFQLTFTLLFSGNW